jgi:glyoxylase-like metal-dependent hydrolase (beta-lactamase superfamily II)
MEKIIYPFDDQLPKTGATQDIYSGLKWVRMPLPFALDHINLWLIRDCFEGRDGWTLVDCGVSNQAIKDAWLNIFDAELEGLPIVRIIVTHMHPDHIGLASWLSEKWSAPLWMTMTDYVLAKWLSDPRGSEVGSVAGGGGAADHFARHGLANEEDLIKIRARANYFSNMVPSVPPRFRRIMDQELIQIGGQDWQVLVGYGHAPEHACLWCVKTQTLISGDMVLPRISTNVSVFDTEPDADPLGLYLDSLTSLKQLPKDALVLPSHGKPFKGLHVRIDQLHEHHRDRLADTLAACKSSPQSARDLVPVLFKRELDLHQLTFAMGEAIAHLNHLWRGGYLLREVCSDGVLRFSCR